MRYAISPLKCSSPFRLRELRVGGGGKEEGMAEVFS